MHNSRSFTELMLHYTVLAKDAKIYPLRKFIWKKKSCFARHTVKSVLNPTKMHLETFKFTSCKWSRFYTFLSSWSALLQVLLVSVTLL